MRLRFLSSNPHKISEVRAILEPAGVEIVPISTKIEELQTADVEKLVHDKCIKAFQRVGYPLFVEHTGLNIDALNGFPGGLTQIFWDTLQADRFSQLFGGGPLSARTVIGYCDGRRVCQVSGAVQGTVARTPQGPTDFQWDCVFIPDGSFETFAQMGPERKNQISMRRHALDAFRHQLEQRHV